MRTDWIMRMVVLAALAGTAGGSAGAGAGLEAWKAAREEEGVSWTSGAAAPGGKAGGEEGARRRLLEELGRAAPVAAGVRQAGRARLRASGEGGEAWALEAREGAATYEAGMRRRGEVWQPLYFCATGLPSAPGATFEEAWARVREVVLRGKTAGVEVSGIRGLAKSGRMRLGTWGGREVEAPWEDAWVFQVDDAPLANWAHPCRYVFVLPDLSAVAVQHARTPLAVRAVRGGEPGEGTSALEVVSAFDRERAAGERRLPRARPGRGAIRYDGSASNCYAVILSGGYNMENNHVRYWGDAAFVYSTLTLKYGYPKGNVYALVADGLDPSADNSGGEDSPKDLDGDGFFDTFGAATAVNIRNLFLNLQESLKATDQLFVFLTDHGGPTEGGAEWEVELNLWNQEVLKDSELQALTEPIACPVFFAMEQCYSGGFVDNLGQANRAVATAARHDESSYAGETFPNFDQWAYHFTAALRGFYPVDETPWEDGEACDGDLNEDGYVSFREAYEYAMEHRYSGDHPTYGENPPGLGARMFAVIPRREDLGIGGLVIDPPGTPQVVHSGFPVRVSAQNVWGDVMSGYEGPAELEADVPPIDPGEYIGTGTQAWDYPLHTWYMDARTQVIYPPETMGGARVLDHLALHVDEAPTYPLSNWTVRVKPTALTAYPEDPVWESEGWTVVVQTNIASAATGWVTMVFQEPFAYDGIQSLMVDFSFHNDGYGSSGLCRASEAGGRVSVTFESDNEDGDPLEWAGRMPPPQPSARYPNLRFGPPPIPVEVEVTPSHLTGFAGGEWRGNVAVGDTNENVRLWATDPAHAGWRGGTGRLAVRDYLLAIVGGPLDFSNGSMRLEWNSFAGRTYRVLEAMSLEEAFQEMAGGIPADPPKNVFIRPGGWNATGFYRVEEE